jgi:D-alanyl-D-alanine carboxypeptidase
MGSMNKMFTGVAICQLVEAGKLTIETKIGDVLPDYPNQSAAETVTVHHLLTHTSGIPSYWNDEYESRWKSLRSVSSLLDLIWEQPPGFEPGSQFEYSNGAPVVLGRMIEVLTGKTYFDYIAQHCLTDGRCPRASLQAQAPPITAI